MLTTQGLKGTHDYYLTVKKHNISKMFQFNFNVDTKNDSDKETFEREEEEGSTDWLPAQRHKITSYSNISKYDDVKEVIVGDVKIKYLAETSALEKLKHERGEECKLSSVFKDHTDLVPAVYEGGMTVWECTFDLLNYLANLDISLMGKRVLELGCGAALPAIYCMLNGAHITVQDYNEEVINFLTIPNVGLNSNETSDTSSSVNPTEDLSTKAVFYSGDWASLNQLLVKDVHKCKTNDPENMTEDACDEERKFDIILTSETIYNPSCHKKLLDLMTTHLKRAGIILVAAKTHYFGVGGGTQEFTDLVKARDDLNVESLLTNESGLKREIIKIYFKENK